MQNQDFIIVVEKVEQLAQWLIHNNKQLTVAESCTGGWVAKVLTDLAGSSAWFERGFVTYSNQSKQEMLGVDAGTLETFGAVSQQTVYEMALGALKHSHADFSLAVSGIAGPAGGLEEKPVGLVWFSWAEKKVSGDNVIFSEQKIFSGDRETVRQQAVVHCLTTLNQLLDDMVE
jgi:nicotinamide-nucleotide amidase